MIYVSLEVQEAKNLVLIFPDGETGIYFLFG